MACVLSGCARRSLLPTLLCAALLISACDSTAENTDNTEGPTMGEAVCGLLDRALVDEIYGDQEYEVVGSGVAGPEERYGGIDCSVAATSGVQARIDVLVVEIPDPSEWSGQKDELADEAKSLGSDCSIPQELTAIGQGYACADYPHSGLHRLRVLAPDRLISVALTRFALADPVGAMVGLARSADDNITAYDREHGDE